MSTRIFEKSSQDTLLEIMLSRRDVRGNHFSDKPIDDETITDLLNAAMTAPSVGLSEPWEFIVIKDLDTRKQIVENFKQANLSAASEFKSKKNQHYKKLKLEGILESTINIAVFYKPPIEPVLGQNSMNEVGRYSVVCAIQNLWLMARAHNIGLGWVSILNPNSVKHTLGVPDNHELVGYLCLGYVKDFLPKPELEVINWKKRRDKDSAIHFERYTA